MSIATKFWDTDPECSICLVDYDPNFANVTILLNCKHKFHTHCLQSWINRQQTFLIQKALDEDGIVLTPLELDAIACPKCTRVFSVRELEYNNFNHANIWPLNPNAPQPNLPEAPQNIDDILIYENIHGALGRSPSILWRNNNDHGPPGAFYEYKPPNYFYYYYKANLRQRCPLPHFLSPIEIPKPTDPLNTIETKLRAAMRNKHIAQNDHSNALEYTDTFFITFLSSRGIVMSKVDSAYNNELRIISRMRLEETEIIRSVIEQIYLDAKKIIEESKTHIGRMRIASRDITKRAHQSLRSITKRARHNLQRSSIINAIKNRLTQQRVANIYGGKIKESKNHNKSRKHNKSRNHNKSSKFKKHKQSKKKISYI